jgi:competence protein ComEC
LTAAHTSLVPLIGLLLLPPLMVLATAALLAGFAFLVVDLLAGPLALLLIPLVRYPLAACVWLVDWTSSWPCSYLYVGEIPQWWLWPAYVGLLIGLTSLSSWNGRVWVPVGLAWLCVGLAAGAARMPTDELRITFVAVGHGGCAVMETPDGKTLLYDVGAISGPEVTTRQVAPFLWSRGIRRIDEVFLSHADLDHFNGLVDLLDRFPIGQVTCTPTFADKDNAAIRHTLAELARRGVPVRIVKAGDRITTGGVTLDILHPPAVGPEGNENCRSMVIRIQHAGHDVLLTGDLEGPGLAQVLGLMSRPVDVLQAPHHNSAKANTELLAQWARPRVVVACAGIPRGLPPPDPYRALGASVLSTHDHGAVTIHSSPRGLSVETFVTRQRLAVRK